MISMSATLGLSLLVTMAPSAGTTKPALAASQASAGCLPPRNRSPRRRQLRLPRLRPRLLHRRLEQLAKPLPTRPHRLPRILARGRSGHPRPRRTPSGPAMVCGLWCSTCGCCSPPSVMPSG